MRKSATNELHATLDDVKSLHKAAWLNAAPVTTEAEAQQQDALDKFRLVAMDLVAAGVGAAILEGAFLVWWHRLACLNRSGNMETSEQSLRHIGVLMAPVQKKLMTLAATIVDDGPIPELARLGERLQDARAMAGGGWSSPTSREEETRQSAIALNRIQELIIKLNDGGTAGGIIEGLLFYFWCRLNVVRSNLPEAMFQTLERNWDLVVAEIDVEVDRFLGRQRP